MLLSKNRLGVLVILVLISGVLYDTIGWYLTDRLHLVFGTLGRQPNLAHTLNPQEHVNREPKTIRHVWKVTTGFRAPDGVRKRVYLINGLSQTSSKQKHDELTPVPGQFPGPWIEARSGDDIVIDVHNDLSGEGVAIHWHGLWMRGKISEQIT
jgi:FtsP/CotA-like multicopper oxidase with cupredoxin domain